MIYNKIANQKKYPFTLPDLPFDKNAFAPDISAETFDYHHDKHHNAYVNKLNDLIKDETSFNSLDLERIIRNSYLECDDLNIFNNAAQVWNHTFFWNSIKPQGGGKPYIYMEEYIDSSFGSYDKFIEEFKQAALGQFGSGWVWLIYNISTKKLDIRKMPDAETPLLYRDGRDGYLYPLLVCDVWEHAYYIDYRNRRLDYIDIFINKMINWEFAEANLREALKHNKSK